VAQKVTRRLQHFIDRKISALFEPLLAMSRDEALTGLARGFAFRLVESLGVIPRDAVATEVKALEQDARAALRKHGVRFGQFTIFLPALLKPAPTRLRLVLWSLDQGLDVFPEAPPAGLVTIPRIEDVSPEVYTMSGYRLAGTRAIRIDMLERLADLLRGSDTRGGFEATPDMLSITGMTLEQFADLMAGLGYAAEKGERAKVKPVPAAAATAEDTAAPDESAADAVPEAAEAAPEVSPDAEAPAEVEATEAETADAPAPEMEVFYTFRWAPRPRGNPNRRRDGQGQGEGRGDRPRREGKPGGSGPRGDRPERGDRKGGKGGPKGKGGKPGPREDKPRQFEARPPKREKPIDPDNPFAAALMGLKTRD
jgi:ATP-dependent RNA helicase SUPV3L1/SUV3